MAYSFFYGLPLTTYHFYSYLCPLISNLLQENVSNQLRDGVHFDSRFI